MKSTALLAALTFTFTANSVPQETGDVVVEVNVLPGKAGGGKFDQANITREGNKVILAPFAGGDGSVLAEVVSAPDGSLYLCGNLAGQPVRELPFTPASAGGGNAFLARLSPDARTMTAITRLPKVFVSAAKTAVAPDGSVVVAGVGADGKTLAVARLSAGLDAIQWVKSVTGDKVASVAVAPDNSVVVSAVSSPFVSRIAPDGKSLVPFGSHETFRIDGANPDIVAAWWEGCGYRDAGYKGGATYQRGGNAGVVALPDGTFVSFSCHFLNHPGGGPDFDPMLVKFDGSGKVLWCTNLLDGLPAEADQKNPVMALDPHTGDILLAATQHGHFAHNFLFTPSAWQNPHPYRTGDIMIGWIARVDPSTGKPKAASFFFPEIPGPLVGGKKRANSLFPFAFTADAEGQFYVTGRSSYKFETTIHAFQSEGHSGGFLAAFSPDLARIVYASLIALPGCDLSPSSIAMAGGGPVVVGGFAANAPAAGSMETSHADATNFLIPKPAGSRGGFLNFTPVSPWQE